MSIFETNKALQQLLVGGVANYAGEIDGDLGPQSIKAFLRQAFAPLSPPDNIDDLVAALYKRPATPLVPQCPNGCQSAVNMIDGAYVDCSRCGAPVTMAPAPSGANPRLAIVAEMQKLVGGRETDGPNQSPAIDALWQYTDYPTGWRDRAPYCAATVCAACHRAAETEPRLKAYPLPTSPSVQYMLEWAQNPKNGCLVFTPGDPQHRARAGDIVSFWPKISHTGVLAQDDDGSGTIHTIEGNTNGAGARDGDGFWAKTRPVSLVGHYIRVAAAVGVRGEGVTR